MIQPPVMIELALAHELLGNLAKRCGKLAAGTSMAMDRAQGLYLGESLLAQFDSPPFDASAMDGVAFSCCEERCFRLVGTVAAGDLPGSIRLAAGECARIMTGAPLPPGADTVEMVEKIKVTGTAVTLLESVTRGQHVRRRGENIRQGSPLFQAGRQLNGAALAALASQGVRRVTALRPFRIGIATTGDELVDYRRPLGPGKIFDSNVYGLAALFNGPEFEVQRLGVCPDDAIGLTQFLAAQTDLDLILLTGGVSMGTFDFVPEAAVKAGFVQEFHKVRMKPGKPLWVGAHPSGTVLFGLPGNPVSAQLSATLFARPFAEARLSGSYLAPKMMRCPLTSAVRNATSLYHFVPAVWGDYEGQLAASPLPIAGSGDLVRFAHSETLLALPPYFEAAIGEFAQVLLPLGPVFR